MIILFSGVFYAGMKYGESTGSTQNRTHAQQFGGQGRGAFGQRSSGGGFVGGEVVSKDDKSITVKLRDGGSKIIFYSPSTQVMKAVSGSAQDLVVGTQVTITGATNSDGSVNAESIQTRPSRNVQ